MADETTQPKDETTPPQDQTTPTAPQEQPQAETTGGELAAAPAEDTGPKNEVIIEEAGTLRKKITIKVPREKIDAKYEELFGELGKSAQVPGFRIGHAPRRLIERRFGKEISEDVRNGLVGEALQETLKEPPFTVLGEPELKLEDIKVPEQGELSFSFEVEVAPEFEVPVYKGIEIKRPIVEINDERVDEAIKSYQQHFARFKPTDGPAQEHDQIIVDAVVSGEGITGSTAANLELRVAPAQVEGLIIEDLPKLISGKKAGESAQTTVKVPAAHANEAWRDKDVTVKLDIKEVKRLELPEANDEFASRIGFGSLAEMRSALADNLKGRVATEQNRAMHEQVAKYLLDNTKLDVPAGVTERYAHRLLSRRVMDLMNRGVAREQLEEHIQELQTAAAGQAATELKLSFILGKIADGEKIDVTEGEVNSRIAQMAAQYKRRPERLRQEMADEGTLDQVATALREEKTLENILTQAKVSDVAAGAEDAQKPAEPQTPEST